MALIYFISDLHLSPEQAQLNQAFKDFIDYCIKTKPKKLYILGDLFDYYLGWDADNDWLHQIAGVIAQLNQHKIPCYFLAGNRDFLVDKPFINKAKMTQLSELTLISEGNNSILLSHGDLFCSNDKAHQLFRKLSQSRLIRGMFLRMPVSYRKQLAEKIRKKGRSRKLSERDILPVDKLIVKKLQKHAAQILIHGHIHRPMIRYISSDSLIFKQLVLPDWRANAEYVVYNTNDNSVNYNQI